MVEYAEFSNQKLTLVAGTYNEVEIACPVSAGNIMAIHAIEFEWDKDLLDGTTDNDYLELALSKKSGSAAIPQIEDSDIIHKVSRRTVGTLAQGLVQDSCMDKRTFYPVLMNPLAKLYFQGICTDAGDVSIRITYTMRKISKEKLLESLIAGV